VKDLYDCWIREGDVQHSKMVMEVECVNYVVVRVSADLDETSMPLIGMLRTLRKRKHMREGGEISNHLEIDSDHSFAL